MSPQHRRAHSHAARARTPAAPTPSPDQTRQRVRVYRRAAHHPSGQALECHGRAAHDEPATLLLVGFTATDTTGNHKAALRAQLPELLAGASRVEITARDCDLTTLAWILSTIKATVGTDAITLTRVQPR